MVQGSAAVTSRRSGPTRLIGVVGLGSRGPGSAPAWGPPPLRLMGEHAAAMAKRHKAVSVALAIVSASPEEQVRAALGFLSRSGSGGPVASACICYSALARTEAARGASAGGLATSRAPAKSAKASPHSALILLRHIIPRTDA